MEPDRAFRAGTEFLSEAGVEGRVQGQAGDLVFVLVSHQLVQVAGDGFDQGGRSRGVGLRGPDSLYEIGVAGGVGRTLVPDQVVGADRDKPAEFGRGVGEYGPRDMAGQRVRSR